MCSSPHQWLGVNKKTDCLYQTCISQIQKYTHDMHDITVWFIYANHFCKFEFQTLDMSNGLPIELGLHTIELISGLDACEQIQKRKENG